VKGGTQCIPVMINFIKASKYSPELQQVMNILPSWTKILGKHAEHQVNSAEFNQGSFLTSCDRICSVVLHYCGEFYTVCLLNFRTNKRHRALNYIKTRAKDGCYLSARLIVRLVVDDRRIPLRITAFLRF